MIFVTVTQRGYTDSTSLFGPFQSVEEGKRKVTDGLSRGIDGDETRYTFFESTSNFYGVMREVGYILFRDECEHDGDDLKVEHFYNRKQ